MELNWDSPHWNKVHSRSGKFLIFATLEKIKPRGQNILTASSYHASYGFSLKWEALVKQIQNIIIAVFEGYFHRNNWFQQSISIVNDVACILDLNNLLWQEMIKEVDDAIIDSSLHAKADGRTITIDDIPRSVTAVVEGQIHNTQPLVAEVKFIDNKTCTKTFTEFFLHGPPLLPNLQSVTIGCTFGMCSSHVLLPPKLAQKKRLSLSKLQVTYDVPPGVCQWLSSSQTPDSLKSLYIQASDLPKMLPSLGRHLQLLRVYWNMYEDKLDESLSFGADVLPVLQTLVIDTLSQSTQVRTFCRVFSRSGLASSLRYIQIRDVVKVSLVLLDDTLAKLDDHVQIAVERARWEFLPKLKSKGVLAIPADIVC
ncbi:hypothetical protein ABKN59_009695 [Abortiporus biennis]